LYDSTIMFHIKRLQIGWQCEWASGMAKCTRNYRV